jgi:oligopeptidase B
MTPPPIPAKQPHAITQHGRERIDEFHWLRDSNWRDAVRDPSLLQADIRAHLDAENAYSLAMMTGTEALQATLFAEMKGRVRDDDSSVPTPDGPYEYFARFAPGAQHPCHVRRLRAGEGEEVLLDADAMAQGKAYFQIGAAEHSPDHALFAYAVDEAGSEAYTLVVRDLATSEDLPERIENIAFAQFLWSPDSQWLFWVHRDENGRPSAIYRRAARGGSPALVYAEPDDGMFLRLSASESRAFILITSANQETSEVRFIKAADPRAEPKIFAPRKTGELYTPTHFDSRWLVLTNADGATSFKIMTCPLQETAREHWTEVLPCRPTHTIEGLIAFADYLVREERVDALPRIVVRDRMTATEHVVQQDEAAYALALEPGYEFDTSVLRFVYQSPTTPRQWIDYDMTSRARIVRKVQDVPSGHDPSRYETIRFFAAAPDGVEVPVTVLKLKATALDGAAPAILYGYGAYGHSLDASFSIRALSLVDRGWIWATAHVRGGADKGRSWFEDGRKEKKINSFLDFVAVAEALIERRHTAARRIVAYGGSAGGLLVGAAANLRPDLWGGVIAAVPFVDALNTMSDDSLPLTPPEWPEWGDPILDAQAFATIAAYSPYDNVADRPYPPILATGGLSDPRVTYWEPAKWIARLRDRAPSFGPYLLKMNMTAGHAGASGRYEFLREIAYEYAFAMRALAQDETGAF